MDQLTGQADQMTRLFNLTAVDIFYQYLRKQNESKNESKKPNCIYYHRREAQNLF